VNDAPLEDMAGVAVGHWTDRHARTGCTVISFEPHALTAVEVRGAAPGTRELDALATGRIEQRADAIVLTGGSAFGLRAADGVAQALASQDRGYRTSAGVVPIVPAAVIFDLGRGEPTAPSPEAGQEGLLDAQRLQFVRQGEVGAGTGASWNKFSPDVRQGGIGIAQTRIDRHLVTAFVVLNAMGAVQGESPDPRAAIVDARVSTGSQGEATTLIAVVTSMPCRHETLTRLCIAAHDALARIVIPAHTMYDGDVAFATTLSEGDVSIRDALRLTLATEFAVESAIRRAALPGT
jgi:L-aminopeptidase/D-esterase-like protein